MKRKILPLIMSAVLAVSAIQTPVSALTTTIVAKSGKIGMKFDSGNYGVIIIHGDSLWFEAGFDIFLVDEDITFGYNTSREFKLSVSNGSWSSSKTFSKTGKMKQVDVTHIGKSVTYKYGY